MLSTNLMAIVTPTRCLRWFFTGIICWRAHLLISINFKFYQFTFRFVLLFMIFKMESRMESDMPTWNHFKSTSKLQNTENLQTIWSRFVVSSQSSWLEKKPSLVKHDFNVFKMMNFFFSSSRYTIGPNRTDKNYLHEKHTKFFSWKSWNDSFRAESFRRRKKNWANDKSW